MSGSLASALAVHAADWPREPLPAECVAFMRARGVSEDIIAKLDACAFAGHLQMGNLSLSRLAAVAAENLEDENSPCIENGFLIIGSGLNGDPIALELETRTVAFISHDKLWEEDYDSFDEVVVRTPLPFDEFWLAAWEDPEFPCDSYEAAEKWPPRTGARRDRS